MEKGNNIIEAVEEERSSAWVEKTSSGKFKFGVKSYHVDVKDAVDEVVKYIRKLKEEIDKIQE